MENAETALGFVSELARARRSLSTDDFGTGYSSLSYLHRFPFARLKIDRSFIGKMDSDAKSEEIVRTILTLADNLHLEVVAEGIETAAQAFWSGMSLYPLRAAPLLLDKTAFETATKL
jgi:EAL domain-containing protein (putative c-di-GMP-specific phosphodiesterase class I)